MFNFYNLSKLEAEEYCDKHKDKVTNQYTFRTDYNQFVNDFAHKTTRYIVTKYQLNVWGEPEPAQILKYNIRFFQSFTWAKDFMREHLEEMDWKDICQSVKLNEKFLREFKDYVDWKEVCKHQKLKKPFIIEMKKYTQKYLKAYFT